MPLIPGAFAAGLLLLPWLPWMPPSWLLPGLAVLVPCCLCWSRLWPLWSLFCGIGAGVLLMQPDLAQWRLPPDPGQVREISGTIIDLPRDQGRSRVFLFRPDRQAGDALPRRILVRWFQPPVEVAAGSRWQLPLRLQSPVAQRNPGSVDMERHYRGLRIGAIGRVQSDGDYWLLGPAKGLHAWREELGTALRQRIDGTDGSSLAVALLVGDRQFISAELRDTLVKTGTAHLIAISGLHVGLVAATAWGLSAALWRGLFRFHHWQIPARMAGIPPALCAATVYAAMAGFALPTQRALVMLLVAMLLLASRRLRRGWIALLLALVGVLLLDPLASLTPGFWLSFGAVVSLFLLLANRPLTPPPWITFVRVQVALLFALLPLTLFWFGRTAWLSPLANLVAVPLVGGLVVPLLMLGAVLLPVWDAAGTFLLQWAAWLLETLNLLLAGGVRLLDAQQRPVPPFWLFLITGPAALLVLLPLGPMRRLCALLLLLLPVLWQPAVPPEGRATITVLDLGHAQASVVRTRHQTLLFDTGATRHRAALAGALRESGIRSVDVLVTSNARAGSIGGAGVLDPLVDRKLGVNADRACDEQPAWQWDGVDFRFLDAGHGNDCLLQIEANGERMLLAHGVTSTTLRRASGLPAVDWLLAPAHGHRDAVSRAAAGALKPHTVIVPIDRHNRFGLPHESFEALWETQGARVLRTGEAGAIRIRLGEHEEARTWRGRATAWWRPMP